MPAAGQLTPRQHQVAILLAKGMARKEAAAELHLDRHTVEYHAHNILQQLGLETITDLTHWSLAAGWHTNPYAPTPTPHPRRKNAS
jgi:DNA-binding NarL/FixJ family response regulator